MANFLSNVENIVNIFLQCVFLFIIGCQGLGGLILYCNCHEDTCEPSLRGRFFSGRYFHGWHPCQPICPWLASLPTNTTIAAKAGAARYHVPRNTRPFVHGWHPCQPILSMVGILANQLSLYVHGWHPCQPKQ